MSYRTLLATIIGLVVFAVAIPAGADTDDESTNQPVAPTYTGVTETEVPARFVPTFAPGVDPVNPARLAVPDHPPIDQIPHMPTPEFDPAKLNRSADRSSSIHDAINDETIRLPVSKSSSEGGPRFGGGYAGPFADSDPLNEDGVAIKSFGGMSQASGLDSYPSSVNAKLVMEYETTGGATVWYVCSGSMQDPEVVLTASHCVYARDPDGNQIFDWAQEIWVYPGWDGSGSTGTTGTREHFGYARGNYFQASNAWINDGEFTYDVGLIRVDRAVGALTGTYGWAHSFSCATVMGRTMYNFSYPSEGCGTPGLHNGSDMYFWSGTVDDCNTTNRFHITTTGGCFDAVWGGMSGSAMYYVDGSSRYAEAVASTSNRSTDAYYARLWDTFVTDMNDTFIPGARTSTFDLQALNAVASPTTITAGQAFTSASFFATNSTNGSVGSTTFPLSARLSTNEILSTSDTLLQSTSWTRAYGAMENGTVTFSVTPTIPLNTPSGNYWFGVVLDSSVDGTSGNNDTSYWDAQPITVNGVAEIEADWISAPSGTFDQGDPLALTFNVDNNGGDPSNTVTVEIRASTNDIISSLDTLIGTYNVGSLSGDSSTSYNESPTLPAGLTGTQYIGMIVSASGDVDGGNNTAYDATPITVTDPAAIFSDGFESGNMTSWSSSTP